MPPGEPKSVRQSGVAGETNSSWESIWRLVLSAEHLPADQRRAFLESAASDPFIIQEAIAILNGSESLASAGPSFPTSSAERFIPQIGMKIGRYRVGTLLGTGGAGNVYSAFDEELNRPVAIKFVSTGRRGTAAPSNLPWREARAASALNHPNIIVIYEVIELGQTIGIAMELVRGVTVRAAVGNHASLNETLRWSAQLADALAVAHDHGLVHGDLKPENVMVRDDGYVKLLDFGLALDVQIGDLGAAQFGGTPRYLAPERYLGQPRSKAADIFALGVVLYELATGRYPFEADNVFDLLQAIREESAPRPRAIRPNLPVSLDDLIMRMLAKEAEARPTARQVTEKLAQVMEGITTERIRRSSRRPWLSVAAALSVLAAVVAGYWFHQQRGRLEFAGMTVRPLASQAGLEDNPSISPDGFWVSCLYRARAADRPQLQVHSTQGRPLVVIETPGLVPEGTAAWSPDSSELAFTARQGATAHSIFRVSRMGGMPAKVADCRPRTDLSCEIDWSPDGTMLAVADQWESNSELYLLDLSSGLRRELISSPKDFITKPRFSPDGKSVAYLWFATMMSDDLYTIAVTGGEPRRITRNPWNFGGYAWSKDGRSLVTISSHMSQHRRIWHLPVDGREAYRGAELDVARGSSPTVSRKSGSLAWVHDLSGTSLWRSSVDQPLRPAEPLVNSAALDLNAEWSSTGRMVFRSDRSGSYELWIAGADGSVPRQATRYRGTFVGDPHWSPDGQSLAFTTHLDGNPDIFVMRCEQTAQSCEEPRQLTKAPVPDANPTWSADGRWIYFSSSRSGRFEVWRLPADGGGEPQQITWNHGYMAHESSDGKWLYFSKLWEGRGFWRISIPARGPEQPETEIITGMPFRAGATWVLGTRELFYYPSTEDPAVPFPSIRAVDLTTGRTRDLPVGNKRLDRGLSLSPDGRWLLRTQVERSQTLIMLAE